MLRERWYRDKERRYRLDIKRERVIFVTEKLCVGRLCTKVREGKCDRIVYESEKESVWICWEKERESAYE